ncbi:MAG: hypothetical protein HDR09_12335 [Lachnospiraceae bacterium]|nr:hypothetical protein [Lachnospiraceae bacterium]
MKTDDKMSLKTAPEEFVNKVSEVSDVIGEVTKALDELETVVLRTSYYWNGEAGDYYRLLYGENQTEIREMMKELRARPERLLQMAGLTQKNRKESELSDPLPADVL